MILPNLERTNVIGTSGAGKSTFAKKLAAHLGQPYIELDLLYWEPNWTEPSDPVFFGRIDRELTLSPRWVLDGNYSRSQPTKWKNVTTVVWLDYSFRRILFQALRRAIRRGILREELWPGTGNRESLFRTFFTKKSIILWTIQTYNRMKNRYDSLEKDSNRAFQFVRLRSPKEAEKFLAQIRSASAEGL